MLCHVVYSATTLSLVCVELFQNTELTLITGAYPLAACSASNRLCYLSLLTLQLCGGGDTGSHQQLTDTRSTAGHQQDEASLSPVVCGPSPDHQREPGAGPAGGSPRPQHGGIHGLHQRTVPAAPALLPPPRPAPRPQPLGNESHGLRLLLLPPGVRGQDAHRAVRRVHLSHREISASQRCHGYRVCLCRTLGFGDGLRFRFFKIFRPIYCVAFV